MDRIVSARVHARRWYVRYPRAMPMAIFVLVLLIAALSVYGIERIQAERAQAQVRAAVIDLGGALESRANTHVTYLRAGAMLLAAAPRIDHEVFQELAAGMTDDDANQNVAAIAWAPRLALRDVAAFEAARRAEGLAGYTVYPRPVAAAGYVAPVTYVSNIGARPSTAIGFDMAAEPQRRAAMALAAHTRRPVATGRVRLVIPNPGMNRPGFLIYMPVYARPAQGGRLLGFVCAPFDAWDFLHATLAPTPARNLSVSLYDGAIRPDRLLARVAGSPNPDLIATRTFTIADRSLVLVIEAPSHSLLSNLSVLTLLFALLVALLLMLLARVVTQNAQEDISSLAWLEEQIAIRNTLTRELNHRVKNTLANVLSIIALTRRRAKGLEEFAESLTGRIMALSATHDLLTGLSWKPAPLRAVIDAELAPYTGGRDHLISVTGPEVALAPQDALSLGMAVHELATNACKYGALSVVAGQVTVNWEMMTPSLARLVWEERGGPVVRDQRRPGFGTDLIQRIVAHELGHEVDLQFDPEGVRCTLVVPVRLPVAFVIREVKGPVGDVPRG